MLNTFSPQLSSMGYATFHEVKYDELNFTLG